MTVTTPEFYGKGQYQGATPDFNKVGDGVAVDGLDGYSWYHTRDKGGADAYGGSDWVQARTGSLSAPGTQAPATPGAQPTVAPPNGQPAPSGYYGGSQAGPLPYNASQNGQGVFMETLGTQMTQPVVPGKNDPVIRAQSDAYAANVERQRRSLMSDEAEKMGPYATGALQGTDLMMRERAGQAQGSFEADLVGREVSARRDEVQRALTTMAGVLSEDQRAKLERERMALDAELQRLGISTAASTAANELSLKDRLGTGGLNIDMMRALLQNQQYADDLGLRTADTAAKWDDAALRRMDW